jgi:hypothetical protein
MIDYENFLHKLASLATSYSDDTSKCIELIKHFQQLLDIIISLENKFNISCNSEKLEQLLNEADIVKTKLYNLDAKNGEVLLKISIEYPLFYKELEFGITEDIIEKYLNILYTIIYIYENNSVSFNTYKEMGNFALKLISDLTCEFLYEETSLDKLMEKFHL